MRRRRTSAEQGFSLLETLVALTLMGLLMASLAAVTGQWLPAWSHGFGRLQRLEDLGVAMQRIASDLAAARFVTANRASAPPLFEGTPSAIQFIREAIGPGAGPRLEWVRLAEAEGALVRSRAGYAPSAEDAAPPQFGAPVALLRSPFRVRFAFAGTDGVWRDAWSGQPTLPALVRVTAFNASTGEALALSTTAAIRVEAPAFCAGKVSIAVCLTQRPGGG